MNQVPIIEILEYLNEKNISYRSVGNTEGSICGYSQLSNYEEGCITWIKNTSVKFDREKRIRMCIIPEGIDINADLMLIVSNPKMVFFEILKKFYTEKKQSNISVDSIVKTSKIGKNVYIGHYCYIGKDVTIGDNVVIMNNVSIECPSIIKDNVSIASGVIIGTDGFGYYQDEQGLYQKVPHLGGVYISENVEIGANTCIDRGTMNDTYIGRNVKIDNLCHIGHNATVEDNSLITAGSIIGGSTNIMENVYVGIGAVVRNQLNIAKNSCIGMGAVVVKDVNEKTMVAGVPAKYIGEAKNEKL